MIVLAIHHQKGGVGKTATAVNLAWLSAREGFRTLLWDLDPQGAASFHLDAAALFQKGARRLRSGERSLCELARPTAHDYLEIVPADPSNRRMDALLCEDGAGVRRLARLLGALEGSYDHVFLDCAPGLTAAAEAVYRAADAVIAPTIPTPLSLRALARLMKWVRKLDLRQLRVLPFFSLVDTRKAVHRETRAWAFGQPLGFLPTSIPYASIVESMSVRRAPLFAFASRSEAALAFEDLWHEIQRELLSQRRPHLVPGLPEAGSPSAPEELGELGARAPGSARIRAEQS